MLAIAYSTVAVVNDSHDVQIKEVPADLKLQREKKAQFKNTEYNSDFLLFS